VEGENSNSGPQPYRAEITNQITPEIPTPHTVVATASIDHGYTCPILPYSDDLAESSLGIPSWRNSTLAAMTHGTEKSGTSLLAIGSSEYKGKEKISDLEEWAAGLEVRLRQEGPTGASYGPIRAG